MNERRIGGVVNHDFSGSEGVHRARPAPGVAGTAGGEETGEGEDESEGDEGADGTRGCRVAHRGAWGQGGSMSI